MTTIDHLGLAVAAIADRLPRWEALGLELEHTETVAGEGVRTAHLRAGESSIELLEPLDDDSPVGKFLARRGEGLHHVALRVADIEAALERAREAGLTPIGAAPRPGSCGTRVAFLHPRTTGGVLLELVEHAPE